MNDCLTLDVIRLTTSDVCLTGRTRVVHVISKTPERISMKFSMCILICMGSICIVFGGWGTSTFFIFFRFCSIFVTCFLCYCALLLTAGETDLVLYYVFWLAQDIFSRCNLVYVLIHEITTRFLNDIFLKK